MSLTRHPLKLIWYRRYPLQLFDLSWDPLQRSNLVAVRPEAARELEGELQSYLDETRMLDAEKGNEPFASPEAIEALRRLGYTE